MINEANDKLAYLKGLKPSDNAQQEYWKGRLEGLEDAFTAIKIEGDWNKIYRKEAEQPM